MSRAWDSGQSTPFGYRDIEPQAIRSPTDRPRLVDVREPAEYVGELGHIDGSELIPLATLEGTASAWDRAQELVVVCRSGARSGRAASLLAQMGFGRVMNMRGGMLAWNELPSAEK